LLPQCGRLGVEFLQHQLRSQMELPHQELVWRVATNAIPLNALRRKMPYVEGNDCIRRTTDGRGHYMPVIGIGNATNGLGWIDGHVYFSIALLFA